MTETVYLEVTEKVQKLNGKERPFSVSGMLKYLGVSRSGYNAWLKRLPSNQHKRRESVKEKIQDIYDKSYQNYGAPKITKELRKDGDTISERTVGKYMRDMGIKAQFVKPYVTTTRNSDFSNSLINILDEQFNPAKPNAVWCTDITYIWTIDGFDYLTSIMDLYSRKIIAWTLSRTLEVSCVIDTINKAKSRRDTENPLIIHSDRGSQYVSKEY
jgi:transposase InsO family protein